MSHSPMKIPGRIYNLGIAFREMGPLDETIGGAQESLPDFAPGRRSRQIIETYTRLIQCLLETGVPEGRKYRTIDGET